MVWIFSAEAGLDSNWKGWELIILHHTPRLVTSDMTALRNASLTRAGIVQLPTMMVRNVLTQDNLIRLPPERVSQREIIHSGV